MNAGKQAQEHRNAVRAAKTQSVHASSALLTNLKPLKDRVGLLQAVLDNPSGQVDSAVVHQLLEPMQLAKNIDFLFMDLSTRWPPVQYESDPEDMPSAGQESEGDDGGPLDEILTTSEPQRKSKKESSPDPRKKDAYGDTDSEDDSSSDDPGKVSATSTQKQNGAQDGDTQLDEPKGTVSKDENNKDKVTKLVHTYPRDPANSWQGADGEPIWISKKCHGVHYRWLLACPMIVDLGPGSPGNKRYAELQCPICRGNFSHGKADYALGYNGIWDHCKEKHTLEACIVRYITFKEVRKIVNGKDTVSMNWLKSDSRSDDLEAKRGSKYSHKNAKCYAARVDKEWNEMSKEKREALMKKAGMMPTHNQKRDPSLSPETLRTQQPGRGSKAAKL
ncbi:hypothetical protein AMS68_006410 [Peltaster fructicola]|uniref:Uncharacterized protein n=1 Tax=Peltaster fructicola TaxID=286661 RepID=A0A6H0Y1L4_9PEZI|nr:hypothetical protein AMS68_006410 [Peltaster fructicola]